MQTNLLNNYVKFHVEIINYFGNSTFVRVRFSCILYVYMVCGKKESQYAVHHFDKSKCSL